MTTFITFKLSQKNFATGLKYAKKFNGSYDATEKTWTIGITSETVRNHLRAPGAYGLIPTTQNWQQKVEEAQY